MNAAASNLINGLYALLGTNAPLEKLRETRRLLADEIENMARRGEEVVLVSRYAAQFDKDFKAVFGDETSITEAKLSASPDQPGYAPDARVIARDPDPAPQGGNAGDAIPPQFLKGKGKDKDEDEDEDEDKDDEKKKKKAKADEAARRLYSRGVLRSPESSPRVTVTRETPEYMRHVEGILAAADDYRATASGYHLTPTDLGRRKYNRETFINPLIEDTVRRHKQSRSAEEWFAREDALLRGGEKALADEMKAASDATLLSTMYNQPTIATALLIQSFQDMVALQFVQGIGPGLESGNGGFQPFPSGNGEIGSVLRIPVEYYEAPSGYGVSGPQDDGGLLVPENTGIDEAVVKTTWLTFAPFWRRIATNLTHDVIRAMANGPLNYAAVGRHIYHMTYDKSRRIDLALLNEMLDVSDEFGAATGGDDTNTTNLLATNSFSGATVNLNPAKTASAAVVAGTDPYKTYGSNVVGGIRLAGPLGSTIPASPSTTAPGFGSVWGAVPIVRPRTTKDLSSAGVLSETVVNAITAAVTGAGTTAPVRGYLDGNGAIQNFPGVTGANYAVDYNNAVVVFTSGLVGSSPAPLAVSSAILANNSGRTFTIAYKYVTNMDNVWVRTTDYAGSSMLATGETPSVWLNRIFTQMDRTFASMGEAPRFMPPNFMVMSMTAATNLTTAAIFYKLMSPDQTLLYPTPDFFMDRNGVLGARINAPWRVGHSRILIGRRGATKYALDVPPEMRGPYPGYDSSGKIIAKDIYYLEENSVICTPQVTDQAGTVLNPVYRTLALRS